MIFQFKKMLLRDSTLRCFDPGVFEFHHLLAFAADQVVVMRFGTPTFIISITTRTKALRDHTRLQKDREIPIDRIA